MIAHGEDEMEVIEIKKIKEKKAVQQSKIRFWIRCMLQEIQFFLQFIVCLMMFLAIFGMVNVFGTIYFLLYFWSAFEFLVFDVYYVVYR